MLLGIRIRYELSAVRIRYGQGGHDTARRRMTPSSRKENICASHNLKGSLKLFSLRDGDEAEEKLQVRALHLLQVRELRDAELAVGAAEPAQELGFVGRRQRKLRANPRHHIARERRRRRRVRDDCAAAVTHTAAAASGATTRVGGPKFSGPVPLGLARCFVQEVRVPRVLVRLHFVPHSRRRRRGLSGVGTGVVLGGGGGVGRSWVGRRPSAHLTRIVSVLVVKSTHGTLPLLRSGCSGRR
mmetsp:Transcript_37550/g.63974  ORF Transcript_37550/g.63974 Transcript_37550/m.63974 type:complete len:242 (+) Transcript_37550:154-879(+)